MIARANQPSPDLSPGANDFYAAGMAAQFQGDKEHAQQYFRRALTLDPLFWPARVAMAESSAETLQTSL